LRGLGRVRQTHDRYLYGHPPEWLHQLTVIIGGVGRAFRGSIVRPRGRACREATVRYWFEGSAALDKILKGGCQMKRHAYIRIRAGKVSAYYRLLHRDPRCPPRTRRSVLIQRAGVPPAVCTLVCGDVLRRRTASFKLFEQQKVSKVSDAVCSSLSMSWR
jgi:hypothetical protein